MSIKPKKSSIAIYIQNPGVLLFNIGKRIWSGIIFSALVDINPIIITIIPSITKNIPNPKSIFVILTK